MLFRTLSFLVSSFTLSGGPAEQAEAVHSAMLAGRSVPAVITSAPLPAPIAAATASTAVVQVSGLSDEGFQAYLPRLRQAALAQGVRPQTLDRIFPNLAFSARTVQLDRQQPGGPPGSNANPPFAPYFARHVTPALIAQGRARYADNIGALNVIRQRYGVDPSVVVAIWGKETAFGRIMGNFDLLNSLASLAYEGRRRDLFTTEFVATLKMVERGFPRSTLQGSWAGATGQSQFLPSVYIRLGVDGDGDGRSDIWNSHIDALASIANYLNNAGWKANVPWGVEVAVPNGFDRASVRNNLRAPRCARVFERHSRWLTMAEWRRLGIVPTGSARIPDTEMASLLEPDGPGQPAYLLTNNYRVILDYNCSNFYGLTVALLADRISR
jgi:lytic murein transglycosylase